MVFLKRIFPILVMCLMLPFMMGSKGCNEGTTWVHPDASRSGDCSECHDDGMSTKTLPKGHNLAWKRNHGDLMHRFKFDSKNSCMLCHSQTSCNNCHQQEKPADHTSFFRLRGHGLMVGMNRNTCSTCHQTDFCQRCHLDTRPVDHNAGFGAGRNRHCLNCHYPLTSAGGQRCAVCHSKTPSHDLAPRQPNNSLHSTGADCRGAGCHTPLRHIDNGMACVVCHPR